MTRLLILFIGLLTNAFALASDEKLDRAFSLYWQADSDRDLRRAVKKLEKAGADFNTVYQRLANGQAYSANVPKGKVMKTRVDTRQTRFPFWIWVPENYDPTRRYPVRIYLHGGINRPPWNDKDGSWWSAHPKQLQNDRIGIFPTSWAAKPWWGQAQIENLKAILDMVKQTYNVDENRVALYGVSDGATGAFYQAMLSPSPWAAVLPFIGHPAVLSNPRNGVDVSLFPGNLHRLPIYMVNGAKDRLYPTESVQPFAAMFKEAGAAIAFHNIENGGHDLNFWPGQGPAIHNWLMQQVRDPHPDSLDWETSTTDCCNRNFWLVIRELGQVTGEPELAPVSSIVYRGSARRAFPSNQAGGRVILNRDGNIVQAQARGVQRFSLLISPDAFDLSQPITVAVNGRIAFEDTVTPDVKTLLAWALEDRDRSQLYAAEIEIEVTPP